MNGGRRKKAIILDHNRGQLANQLWNYMSIYAYCLERGYSLENPSFGDYREHFDLYLRKPWTDALFFNAHAKSRLYILLRPYYRYTRMVRRFKNDCAVDSGQAPHDVVHLPPSHEADALIEKVRRIEKSPCSRIYFCGGRFRNPIGIEKYRAEIVSYFQPNQKTALLVAAAFHAHRASYDHVVGVHIRQTDFKTDKQGHYVPPAAFSSVMKKYLELNRHPISKTLFIICSDEKIDPKDFAGLNVHLNDGTMGEDLFTLARTDAIIGSNSTFGAFAAYYGNIPLMVVGNGPMDWDYYSGKKAYFENKYCTVVKY